MFIRWLMLMLLLMPVLWGCGAGGDGGGASVDGAGGAPSFRAPGGNLGATPGGTQDLHFAREVVKEGKVPPADAFIVEAMYSEHDLPLVGAECFSELCIKGAIGVAPDAQGNQAAWLQVGMSSNIKIETFERDPMVLIATVDVSGSMSGSPLSTAKRALSAMANQLTGADSFALVSFGSDVSTNLSLTSGIDERVIASISDLSAGGSTYLEAGLKRAYEIADQAREFSNNVRIVLFTDIQPNVGATLPSQFEQMVLSGANKDIGITVMGIGLGLGAEFLEPLSYVRGANAFSLIDVDEVESFMSDNWPWMVSPIAYDLNVTIQCPSQVAIVDTYGFPDNGSGQEVSVDVATVFLSKNRGALLLKLESDNYQSVSSDLRLSYVDKSGELIETSITADYESDGIEGTGIDMPQPGIDKTVALTLLVTEMKAAAEIYQSDRAAAIAILESALARFQSDAERIQDAEISAEAAFWNQLLVLMMEGAEQGNFYGQTM